MEILCWCLAFFVGRWGVLWASIGIPSRVTNL